MIVLITGATGGFGRVLVAILTKAGHTVFGTSRNPDAEAAEGPLLKLDVTSTPSVEACIQSVIDQAGSIDVVIMQPVAMAIERAATGTHLRLGTKVAADSFGHKVVDVMAQDSRTSKLTPELVAEKVLSVIDGKERPLRIPMDRAAVLSKVKRILPQRAINKLIDTLLTRGAA